MLSPGHSITVFSLAFPAGSVITLLSDAFADHYMRIHDSSFRDICIIKGIINGDRIWQTITSTGRWKKIWTFIRLLN